MKYFPLLHILPVDIVKIIIDKLEIESTNYIIDFYRLRKLKQSIIKNLITTLIIDFDNFTSVYNISKLKFILDNNWSIYYNRKFWCCFANILIEKIMHEHIHIQMNRESECYTYNNKNSKNLTKTWFQICKKYNLILQVTFYNFESKKGKKEVVSPARNFIKPINSLNNILYKPLVLFNENNFYYSMDRVQMINYLYKYSFIM
tara:strand:- start:157 stop:765 length:609 start_codon:yes stop_codon:yes gene_type:complete